MHDLSGLEYCDDLFNFSAFGNAIERVATDLLDLVPRPLLAHPREVRAIAPDLLGDRAEVLQASGCDAPVRFYNDIDLRRECIERVAPMGAGDRKFVRLLIRQTFIRKLPPEFVEP